MADNDEIELTLVSSADDQVNGDSTPSHCSFCGKSKAEVGCLLTSHCAAICDACIERYKTALAQEAPEKDG